MNIQNTKRSKISDTSLSIPSTAFPWLSVITKLDPLGYLTDFENFVQRGKEEINVIRELINDGCFFSWEIERCTANNKINTKNTIYLIFIFINLNVCHIRMLPRMNLFIEMYVCVEACNKMNVCGVFSDPWLTGTFHIKIWTRLKLSKTIILLHNGIIIRSLTPMNAEFYPLPIFLWKFYSFHTFDFELHCYVP